MSRIPYLDTLGDEFERAITASQTRRPRPVTVAAVAFVFVLVAGASLWLLRGGRDPDVAEPTTTTTTTQPEAMPSLPAAPESWARVPAQDAFGVTERTTLSSVAATPSGFVAVGAAGSDPLSGLMLESDDGIEWTVLARADGASLHDVAHGPAGLTAAGMAEFMPVIAREDGSLEVLPVTPGAGERVFNTFAIAATDTGLVVAGIEQRYENEQSERPAVWWSDDGIEWVAVDSAAFRWHYTASVSDLVVNNGTVVAVGLIGGNSGNSAPTAWVSTDGANWEQHEMPAPTDLGFTGASGAAYGHGRYVAAGFSPSSSGRVGAVWTSEDGRTWEWVDDEDLAGVDGAETWIHSVTPVADGFIAVGHSFETPRSRPVIWTSDATGTEWERLDLVDPGEHGATSAAGVAADSERVVVVGSAFDITYSEGVGAVWVGPAPPTLEASGPLETTTTTEPPPDSVSLSVDPQQAVSATSVRVVGRLPEGYVEDEIVVELRADDGTMIELCRAVRQGRNFMCRATIGDVEPQLGPGLYEVIAPAVGGASEPVLLEVLAAGTRIVQLTGIYTPTYGPLLQTLSVQNKGGDSLDLTGWSIVNEGRDEPRFDFPADTMVPPGTSVLLDFSGSFGGQICPDDGPLHFHWCNVVEDPNPYGFEENPLWKGGLLQLLDNSGNLVSEWQPGS